MSWTATARQDWKFSSSSYIRRFLRASLGAQGYSLIEAEDGETGPAMLQRNAIDVLVLDLGLPGMGGLDVLRKPRADGSSLPVIVLSSRDDETSKVTALDMGADDYVTKPFGMDELLARIRAAVRHKLLQGGEKPVFRSGDLTVDLVRRIVTERGSEVTHSHETHTSGPLWV